MSLLQFKTVTLCDKSWVDPIVMAENSPSADYNFGNIYIWDKFYKQLICRFEDRMITKLRYEGERALRDGKTLSGTGGCFSRALHL